MKRIKKTLLMVFSLLLALSIKNLSAVEVHGVPNQNSFQEFTSNKTKHKVSKTSKSSKEKPKKSTVSTRRHAFPTYKLQKILGKRICSYISRKELDENQIYMAITNINHNIDIISEKPSFLGDDEMDKIRIQFNNCTPEIKKSILEYIKQKNYYLTSFYSPDENILLVNLNLSYHRQNIQKIKKTFRIDAPKIFEGKNLKLDVLENVGQIVYDPARKKFIVSFGNTHGDLLFKISRYFCEKNYKVWCRKESKSMSVAMENEVTYDRIKNELNTYMENNPLYVPYADEILKF